MFFKNFSGWPPAGTPPPDKGQWKILLLLSKRDLAEIAVNLTIYHYRGILISRERFKMLPGSMLRSGIKHSKNYKKWKKEWASSHTPCSNIAWECCIQRMAIPSISDQQLDRKPVSSKLNKIIFAKVEKGYKVHLKKIMTAFPLRMCIYILCPT